MFTGLISHVGRVRAVENEGAGRAFWIASDMDTSAMPVGASVAHAGVCLTVTEKGERDWRVYASPETLARTTLGTWIEGTSVNLEASLRLGDELGGHLVFGHVDAVGDVVEVKEEGQGRWLTFGLPETMVPLVAVKGSIAVDGISLTVTAVTEDTFSVAVIPHTWDVTTLRSCQIGDLVNLEADMFARYVARQLAFAEGGVRG